MKSKTQKSADFIKCYFTRKDKLNEHKMIVKEEERKRRFTRIFFTVTIGGSIMIDGLLICLMMFGVNPKYLIPIVATSTQLKLWGGILFSKIF